MSGALDLARPAGDGDSVGGVPARLVATPASTEEAAAVLRAAADRDLAVVVRGGGTTVDWGNPPERLDLIVDTRRMAGVVEHAAGDLITVVRASGTCFIASRPRSWATARPVPCWPPARRCW